MSIYHLTIALFNVIIHTATKALPWDVKMITNFDACHPHIPILLAYIGIFNILTSNTIFYKLYRQRHNYDK